MLLGGLGDGKKTATQIVIAMGPKRPFSERKEKGYNEENVNPEKADKDYNEYNAFAEEMISAIDKKDTEALASTLKAYHSMCMGGMSETEEPEEE